MLRVKYVKLHDPEVNQNYIIIFPEQVTHKSLDTLRHYSSLSMGTWHRIEAVSAGFISFATDEDGKTTCHCYGNSVSLGLRSEPEDSKIASLQFFGT